MSETREVKLSFGTLAVFVMVMFFMLTATGAFFSEIANQQEELNTSMETLVKYQKQMMFFQGEFNRDFKVLVEQLAQQKGKEKDNANKGQD